jgi:DNA (cytosine-5)-methyltransferase 1
MNELALFAGAGGGLLASELLGWRTICAVEYAAYPASILCARQNDGFLPPFPIWDDVSTFDGRTWHGVVDIVSGGFPCQAFSTAARGANIASKNLWPQMRRIVQEVRPKFVFAENVTENAIEMAACDLLADGYNSRYIKLSASDVGADHIRDRFWLLAYTDVHSKFCSTVNAETQRLSQLCNSVWQTIPDQLRVFDGVAHRMDRLKALGNGQVPLVAAVAFLKLWEEITC